MVKRERAVVRMGWGRMVAGDVGILVADSQWDLRCGQLIGCGLLSWEEVRGFFILEMNDL